MIELGLSEEYLSGYSARVEEKPFDKAQSDDWIMGWQNADIVIDRISPTKESLK